MMFKRPRLRPTCRLVNAGFAAAVIFLAACSREAPEEPNTTDTNIAEIAASPSPEGLEIPAVWSTSPLPAPIVDIALSGGASPLVAVVMDTGELQLFDMQGDRRTTPVDLGVKAIGDGHPVELDGANLTLFPGIGEDGALNVYVYNTVLGEPIALPLLPEAGAAGLCVGPVAPEHGLIFAGYWTAENQARLEFGSITNNKGDLEWDPAGRADNPDIAISSCDFFSLAPILSASPVIDMARLTQDDQIRTIENLQGEGLRAFAEPITIRDGISVRAPNPITAMAALSDVQFGGYPNGVIVIGGPVNGEHQIVFVEPGPLFNDAP